MTVDAGRGDGAQGTGAPAPVLHPGDPRQAGGVRLLGRLGEGGMGVVFLGQAADGRRVAVKVIRADYARDRHFLARFAAEAAAARRVARFCTAQVLDAGTDGDVAYLVTEYIEGPTLTAALEADGPMRGSTLDSLAIGIAVALNGIHAASIAHRDLKPGNVILSRVGPKVIDFGIARALDDQARLTASGDIVGTPAYMAPEQFRGTATTATDVFSWGAVVTFAATGRPPFGTGAPYELMHRILTDPPRLDGLEQPLRGLVAQALDKDPDRRPTARALLLALVGDAADPIDAGTRILSAQWTPPPAPTTLPDPAPTRLDDAPALTRLDDGPALTRLDGVPRPTAPGDPHAPTRQSNCHATGPLLGRRVVERSPAGRSRRTRALVALAAAALAAVVVVAASQGWWGGDPGGQTPGGDPSVSASAGQPSTPAGLVSTPAGQRTPSVGGSGLQPITIGVRVPEQGEVSLGFAKTRSYLLHLDTDRVLYLTGYVCRDLVPWQIFHLGGARVAGSSLGCLQYGPLTLRAGDYELRLGGDGFEGSFAFEVTAR
ncbi:serine/threonine-protein kinase [Catellatospora methionotrophica]|uniref:serine/threonine-protein kinase n=1 Tax=Catellatospora methionotrophica TaxID=121620 RepID=UPI0034021EAD